MEENTSFFSISYNWNPNSSFSSSFRLQVLQVLDWFVWKTRFLVSLSSYFLPSISLHPPVGHIMAAPLWARYRSVKKRVFSLHTFAKYLLISLLGHRASLSLYCRVLYTIQRNFKCSGSELATACIRCGR